MEDLNRYIKKSHIKAVEKLNEELRQWSEYTNGTPDEAELYEDQYTVFTLSNLRVENGCLCYCFDGREERENKVCQYEDTKEYYEEEGLDSIPECVKFWRACLRRAKRYFAMDTDKLDSLQSGEEDDEDDDDE